MHAQIPGKYVTIADAAPDEIEMMPTVPLEDVVRPLRVRPEFRYIGSLSPTNSPPASPPASPPPAARSPLARRNSLSPETEQSTTTVVMAQVHQKSRPPSPASTEQPQRPRPRPQPRQSGLDDIQLLSSQSIAPAAAEKSSSTRKSARIARNLRDKPVRYTDVDENEDDDPVDPPHEDPIPSGQMRPSQRAAESTHFDCSPDESVSTNVAVKSNDASNDAKRRPLKAEPVAKPNQSQTTQSRALVVDQRQPAAEIDPYAFAEDTKSARKQPTAKAKKPSSKAKAQPKPKPPNAPKWMALACKPPPPLKIAVKRAAANDSGAASKRKYGHQLFDPSSYNNETVYFDENANENAAGAPMERPRATLLKKDRDQLTTASFDSIIMQDPKQQVARISHNVMRINKSARVPALAPIDANVAQELQQLRATQPNRAPCYSYRKSTATTTTTTLVTAEPLGHGQAAPPSTTMDTPDAVEVETGE